jgi:hypothetical protein
LLLGAERRREHAQKQRCLENKNIQYLLVQFSASPIHSSKPSSASKRSNQRECPVASIPTRTWTPFCFSDGRTFQLLHRCASTASGHIPQSPCLPRRYAYANEHLGSFLPSPCSSHHQVYSDRGEPMPS